MIVFQRINKRVDHTGFGLVIIGLDLFCIIIGVVAVPVNDGNSELRMLIDQHDPFRSVKDR